MFIVYCNRNLKKEIVNQSMYKPLTTGTSIWIAQEKKGT